MPQIRIDVGAVVGLSSTVNGAKNKIYNVRTSLNNTRNQMDSRLANRNNIGSRINAVYSQLVGIESRLARIDNTVSSGANKYRSTDIQVLGLARNIPNSTVGAGVGSVWASAFITGDVSNQAKDKTKVEKKEDNSEIFGIPASLLYEIKEKYSEQYVDEDKTINEGGIFSEKVAASFLQAEALLGLDFCTGRTIKHESVSSDWRSGNLYNEHEYSANGTVLEGKIGINQGDIGTSQEFSILKGEVYAGAGINVMGNYDLSSSKAYVGAEAKGEVFSHMRIDKLLSILPIAQDVSALGGEIGVIESIGSFTYEDPVSRELKTDYGIKREVSAEAYALKCSLGTVTGNLFGIKVMAELSETVGSIGTSAGYSIGTQAAVFDLSAAFEEGADVKITLDWS